MNTAHSFRFDKSGMILTYSYEREIWNTGGYIETVNEDVRISWELLQKICKYKDDADREMRNIEKQKQKQLEDDIKETEKRLELLKSKKKENLS